MKKTALLSLILLAAAWSAAAHGYSREDSLRVDGLLSSLAKEKERPLGTVFFLAAQSMIGTPYVAGLLGDGSVEEELRTPVVKTDCILFVETMLAVARTVRSGGDFADFRSFILDSRYRDGKVRYFSDRVHYTTEWIRRLEAEGILRDITEDLGGVSYDHPISYMSAHPDAYNMGEDDLRRIKKIEKQLNSKPLTYIPGDKIAEVRDKIRSGDIICFVTSVEGLDISHVAVACKYTEYHNSIDSEPRSELGFIHASQVAGKVIVDPRSVSRYVSLRKSCPGIKVLRLKD